MTAFPETSARIRVPKAQFGRFLRSGRWNMPDEPGDGVELKFNPWHDPATGRFTFKGGGNGTWGGGGFTGGGGGSTGGGGASGSWKGPAKSQPSRIDSLGTTAASVSSTSNAQSGTASATSPQMAGTTVTRNGYTYQIDDAGRTTQVTGTLTLAPDPARSRSAQAAAGGADRLPTDDGGHYVAARFNGPTDSFNHFAQDANFNRGGYRVLENQWANDIKKGDAVWVSIVPGYSGSSQRPNEIDLFYSVNGQADRQSFNNGSSKEKSHGG